MTARPARVQSARAPTASPSSTSWSRRASSARFPRRPHARRVPRARRAPAWRRFARCTRCPRTFRARRARSPVTGNVCSAVAARVAEHQVGADEWCTTCVREYTRFKKTFVPSSTARVAVGLRLGVTLSELVSAARAPEARYETLVLAPLMRLALWRARPVAHGCGAGVLAILCLVHPGSTRHHCAAPHTIPIQSVAPPEALPTLGPPEGSVRASLRAGRAWAVPPAAPPTESESCAVARWVARRARCADGDCPRTPACATADGRRAAPPPRAPTPSAARARGSRSAPRCARRATTATESVTPTSSPTATRAVDESREVFLNRVYSRTHVVHTRPRRPDARGKPGRHRRCTRFRNWAWRTPSTEVRGHLVQRANRLAQAGARRARGPRRA